VSNTDFTVQTKFAPVSIRFSGDRAIEVILDLDTPVSVANPQKYGASITKYAVRLARNFGHDGIRLNASDNDAVVGKLNEAAAEMGIELEMDTDEKLCQLQARLDAIPGESITVAINPEWAERRQAEIEETHRKMGEALDKFTA
jgi:hypothetical protein